MKQLPREDGSAGRAAERSWQDAFENKIPEKVERDLKLNLVSDVKVYLENYLERLIAQLKPRSLF